MASQFAVHSVDSKTLKERYQICTNYAQANIEAIKLMNSEGRPLHIKVVQKINHQWVEIPSSVT